MAEGNTIRQKRAREMELNSSGQLCGGKGATISFNKGTESRIKKKESSAEGEMDFCRSSA